MAEANLTAQRLREVLDYNQETGEFRRKTTRRRWAAGQIAEGTMRLGYIHIGVDGKQYRAHRLAWLYVVGSWPSNDIDHINGKRSDNRWCNLREVTRSENLQNIRRPRGKSGLMGAHYHKATACWKSSIRAGGTLVYLGYFPTAEAAHAAYMLAKSKLHISGAASI